MKNNHLKLALYVLLSFLTLGLATGQTAAQSMPGNLALQPFQPAGAFFSYSVPHANNLELGYGDRLMVSDLQAAYSMEDGEIWHDIASDLGDGYVYSLASSPLPGHNLMLMGTNRVAEDGIWRSYNQGIDWVRATSIDYYWNNIVQISFSPTYKKDNTIYARSFLEGGTTGAILKSIDEGQNWLDVMPAAGQGPTSLAITPNFAQSQTIFIGIGTEGISRSSNAGQTWASTNNGLNLAQGNAVQKVIISPHYATDRTLFAVTSLGVYKSINNGSSWIRILPYVISDFRPHPEYGSTSQLFFFIARVQDNSGILHDALFKTIENSGVFNGLLLDISDFEFSTALRTTHKIFALTDYGFLSSTNLGDDWQLKAITPTLRDPLELVTSPNIANDGKLWAVYGNNEMLSLENAIWYSHDFGASWNSYAVPDPMSPILDLAISPDFANDNALFLLSESGSGARLYRSTTNGQTWQTLGSNLPPANNSRLRLSPNYAADQTIFINYRDNGLFRSTNNGQSWQNINTASHIVDFAIAPSYPADPRIYVSIQNGIIQVSEDMGASWQTLSTPFGTTFNLTLSPNLAQDNTLFLLDVGISTSPMYRTTDGGQSWQSAAPFSSRKNNIAISPNFADDQTIIVHTQTPRGVLWSEDAGTTWFELEGLAFGATEEFGYTTLPVIDGRPTPVSLSLGGVSIYRWPQNLQATFGCGPLMLGAPDVQNARVAVSADTLLPVFWSADTSAISWLNAINPEGFTPELGYLEVDTSGITTATLETFPVDVFLSLHQMETLQVPAFVPCNAVDLPIIVSQ